MWIFQLKFIPIVYKELIIHRIKKEFNHKELLVLLVMGCSLPPLGGTGACYPRNLFFVFSIYLYITYF